MFFEDNNAAKPLDLKTELLKLQRAQKRFKSDRPSTYFHESQTGFQSAFFDPYLNVQNQYGNLKTADRMLNRDVDPWTLRRVAKKAWIINVCVKHIQDRIKPYLKPSTKNNYRGYVIHRRGEDAEKTIGRTGKDIARINDFISNCGVDLDSDRDKFQKFCMKAVRDLLEIDQCSAEIAYRKNGEPYCFKYVDAATIEKVLPEQDNPYNIKFVQLINSIPTAYFPEGTLVFDYMNPRSDVRFSFYGYSPVEQCIDLVTSVINTFNYNAGFFTENKLPRGMLLLDGNASQETVEEMEDYICDIMSGSTSNQWRVPIIPSGGGSNGENNSIKWVQLGGTNKEMEFQNWLDFLTSGLVAIYGLSIDELGIHSQKSQPVFEHNNSPELEASKSLTLGNILGFLQQYINQILQVFFPEWEIEFIGYEFKDPKAIVDLAKSELESYKTLNEVRKEKGLPALKSKFADECPANPQLVQLYQSEQAQSQGGDMGDFGGGEEEGNEGGDFGETEEGAENIDGGAEEETTENGGGNDEEGKVDENAWGELPGNEKAEPPDVQKSLRKSIIINL